MANKETDRLTSYPTTFIESAGTQTKRRDSVLHELYGRFMTPSEPKFGSRTIPDQTYTRRLAIDDLTCRKPAGGAGTIRSRLTPAMRCGMSLPALTTCAYSSIPTARTPRAALIGARAFAGARLQPRSRRADPPDRCRVQPRHPQRHRVRGGRRLRSPTAAPSSTTSRRRRDGADASIYGDVREQEGRQEGRQEGELRGKVLTIKAFLQ